MSNCPRSASGTVMPTFTTPLPSPIPTPTPSYTTTTRVVATAPTVIGPTSSTPLHSPNLTPASTYTTTTRVESYIPTEPTLSTDHQTPGFASTGLIVGIVIPVFAVGLTVFLMIVIIFIQTAKKSRIQQTHASKWYIETKLIFYTCMEHISFFPHSTKRTALYINTNRAVVNLT